MQKPFKDFFRDISIINIIAVFILVIVSSSSPQILESAPGQSLIGNIALGDSPSVEGMVVSAQVKMAGLSPSEPPNRQQGSIIVNFPGQSQRPWNIKVKADDTTAGYMTEFDISNNNYIDNGKHLRTPMFVWIDEDNKADLSKGETSLKSGKGSGTFPVYFEQAAVWGDAALPQGREYHLTIIFTLS